MNHIQQNERNNCGQTCVRMITGNSLSDVEKLMDKRGLSRTSDLKKAIILFYAVSDVMIMTKHRYKYLYDEQRVPVPCVCMVRPKDSKYKHRGHWIVLYDKYVYDPSLQNKMRIRSYLKRLEKQERKITSYFSVVKSYE